MSIDKPSQEQQKNKDLEVQLKEKDVIVRSTLEENELLNFNNQRLTKRITILQAEIAEVGDYWFFIHSKNSTRTAKQERRGLKLVFKKVGLAQQTRLRSGHAGVGSENRRKW